MKHVFILDPEFFREQQWKFQNICDNIDLFFRKQARSEYSVHTPRYPRESTGIIREQYETIKTGETLRIYAIGGDEIFFDCVNGTAGIPNAELAFVTCGNTDSFLKILGIEKRDLSKNLEALTTAPSLQTDIITAGNQIALNGCMAGIVAAQVAKQKKFILGKKEDKLSLFFRMAASFILKTRVLFDRETVNHQYTITIDGLDHSGKYSHIGIANGPYYDGNKIASLTAKPDDGVLDITLLKSARAFSTAGSLRKLWRGIIPSGGITLRGRSVSVKSDVPFWIQLDGELIQDTMVNFAVQPGAIQIISVNNNRYEQNITDRNIQNRGEQEQMQKELNYG